MKREYEKIHVSTCQLLIFKVTWSAAGRSKRRIVLYYILKNRQISNICCTKSQNLNVSRLVLQSALHNLL